MNKLYIILFSFILLISCSDNDKINWENDFNKALEKSKSENKIIMIYIYTDWCGICKEMDKTTFADKSVIDNAFNFTALKFNPEKASESNRKDIQKRYNILGYPTIIFINSSGFVLKKLAGYIDSNELVNEMNGIKERNERVNNVFKDDNAGIEKLDIYLESGYDDEALNMYNELVRENKISENNMPKYMCRIALLLLDNNRYEEGMKYFDDIINKYGSYNEVYIAHYYKALDMVINNGLTNDGVKYIENLTNKIPNEMKADYLDFINYFSSNYN